MKAYIASSFNLKPKIEQVEQFLEQRGITVICKWWTGLDYIPHEQRTLKDKAKDVSPAEFYSSQGCKTAFERDFNAVKEADFLVFVAADYPRKYNGGNVELGIALGDGKPCFSIGTLENSAMYYKVRQCKNLETLWFIIVDTFRELLKTVRDETK
jgi:hypothetical protein